MDSSRCDAIVLSAMAWMDGEAAPIDRAEIDVHILTCRHCASEIEMLRSIAEKLVPVSRAAVTADVGPGLEARVGRSGAIPPALVLTAGSVFLLGWRALETVTMDPLALWNRLVIVGVAGLVFLCLRTNPFRIETRLV